MGDLFNPELSSTAFDPSEDGWEDPRICRHGELRVYLDDCQLCYDGERQAEDEPFPR